MNASTIQVRWLGKQDYDTTWQAMRQFTNNRNDDTPDEIWLVEHSPVFTQGQNGKAEHLLVPNDIPLIHTDRGGQITYHGPGQLMVYTLIDTRRYQLGVRALVTLLEQSVIDLLADFHIQGETTCSAPGVYVNGAKICSIGLRIRRGCAYHGIAFNVAMDLTPFSYINPCGFSGLKMTQFSALGGLSDVQETGQRLAACLIKRLQN